ncbi:MAG TPA: hypothetical protein VN203_20705 [Candidatus Acidoferrum sp.]|nr:hypothetical protein [Candidatus Acidoferrum sp.]
MSKTCNKCGKVMPDGSLAYEVKIQVYADFDGVLPEVRTADEMEARLRELVAAMDEADPDKLMCDVYHEERRLVCPGCRDRYLANPLNLPLRENPA